MSLGHAQSQTGGSRPKYSPAALLAPIILLAAAALFLMLSAAPALAAPDLSVSDSDVSISVRSPTQDNTVTLYAEVHNLGDANATNFTVRFTLDGSATLANVAVSRLGPGASTNVSASWSVGSTATGAHSVTATADATFVVTESNEANNAGAKSFSVNAAPTANATVNSSTLLSLYTFAFDGSTSTDSDGTLQSYLWLFDDGSTGSGSTATHAYTDGGAGAGKAYTVTLIVTDNDGGTGSKQTTVHVTNRAPTAAASNVTGLTVTTLAFDGSASSDLDGRIVNATWAFSDGATLYGLTVLRQFGDNGAFTATLTVRDEDGANSSHVISITVSNQPPNPVITTTPAMPFQPAQSAFFDGKASFDVDGGIANYTWVFPGGVTSYGWNATQSFAVNGTYNVTLVLIDDDGAVGQLTVAVLVGNDTVGTRVPTPPIGRISPSATTVFTGALVTFDASNSTDDTGIISYLWDFGDGAVGVGVVASHAWSNDGNYIVALNVTDTDGNSTIATVTIHVKDRPPVAALSASPTSSLTLNTISFDASGSSDPDGTLLYYRWDYGDGSVLYGRTTQHVYSRAGIYGVMLTVTDNDGSTASSSVLVTITNRAPTAVTPANFAVPTFEERIFDASASFDLDGLIQTYSWNFGDGFSSSGRSVKHAFSAVGGYTVTLTVRDDFGAAGVATMTVTVTNNAPSALIAGPASIYTGDTANFVGTGTDRDGTITAWNWNWGDGSPAGTTAGAGSHAYPAKGAYTVTLTVTDNNSATGVATFSLRVLNRLPTAVIAQPSPGFTTASGTGVTFSATGSRDPETPAAQLQFFWILGDGGVASGESITHAFARAGAFTVILTVSDGDGGAASATVPVVIQNRPPVARPAADNTTVDSLTPVLFEGGASSDPDGIVQSYLWEFGDGATSSVKTVSHAFASAAEGGVYHVQLTVFDDQGLTSSSTIDITVQNRLPTASIAHGSPVYATLAAVFKGTTSADLDGIIVNWSWNFGDSTGVAYGSQVTHTYLTTGSYSLQLTVTDNRGGQKTVNETLIVEAKPVYNQGGGGGGTQPPPQAPGFEALGGLAALGAAAFVAARRRR